MKHYRVVPFEDTFPVDDHRESSKPTATVMFDDGFRDNLEYAAAILREENCPASFYVVTGCVDTGMPTWTYCLDYRILNTHKLELILESRVLADSFKRFSLDSQEGRVSCGRRLKPFLKGLTQSARVQILDQIDEQLSDCEISRCMMSWKEVSQLASDGFTIGSHSVTHPLLASIEDPSLLDYELAYSRDRICNQLGTVPKSISYPIGSVSAAVMDASRKAGYEIGLAVENRPYQSKDDDVFSVPRMELYNESWAKTLLRMHGWIHRLKSWRKAA